LIGAVYLTRVASVQVVLLDLPAKLLAEDPLGNHVTFKGAAGKMVDVIATTGGLVMSVRYRAKALNKGKESALLMVIASKAASRHFNPGAPNSFWLQTSLGRDRLLVSLLEVIAAATQDM